MRRVLKGLGLLGVIVVVNVVTVCVFLGSLPIGQAGEGKTESCNRADINGDGSETLADALKLLKYLFQEGDPPAACAEQPPQLTKEELALIQELAKYISVIDVEDPSDEETTYKTIRFEEVNVHIVNGLGAMDFPEGPLEDDEDDIKANGLGNLIVGYDNINRGGSHNVVVGTGLVYESIGGLAVGLENRIEGPYCFAAGAFNSAEGPGSSVSGGASNKATGVSSSITGGDLNEASGDCSSVTGGSLNVASRFCASIGGGTENEASGR